MANPYFNANYYLANNPDLFAAGINTVEGAWEHYVNYGAAEAIVGQASRSPAPWFDISYYYTQNPDFATAGLTPAQLFEHFVNHGIDEGRAPSSDAQLTEESLLAYAKANEDLEDAFEIEADATELTADQQAALARHFYEYGYKEDREGKPFEIEEDNTGETFTLTAGVDTIQGTAADEVINAVPVNAADSKDVTTLNAYDVIDGGAGNDTLNIYTSSVAGVGDDAEPTAYNTTQQGTVRNVETINIYNTAGAVFGDGTVGGTVQADKFVGSQQVWQIGQAAHVAGIAASQTVGFRNIDVADTQNVNLSFTGAVANIALDGDDQLEFSIIDVKSATNDVALTTLNISGRTDGLLEIGATDGAAKLQTVNLALENATNISVGASVGTDTSAGFLNVKTIDASASKGALNIGFGEGVAGSALETLTLGSGNDTVGINIGAFDVAGKSDVGVLTVALGAGNDEISVGGVQSEGDATALSITLGAGIDTIRFSVDGEEGEELVANIGSDDEAEFLEGLITVTDFGSDDLVDFGIPALAFTAANVVSRALAGDDVDSLYDAINAIAADEDFTGVAVFQRDGNTYFYADQGGDAAGLSAGDTLIEFTGEVTFNQENVIGWSL